MMCRLRQESSRPSLEVTGKYIVGTSKEVFEEVNAGVGPQEVICGAYKYQKFIGVFCLKGVDSMVYGIFDEA